METIKKIRVDKMARLDFVLDDPGDPGVGLMGSLLEFSLLLPFEFIENYNNDFNDEDKRNFNECLKDLGLWINPEAKLMTKEEFNHGF